MVTRNPIETEPEEDERPAPPVATDLGDADAAGAQATTREPVIGQPSAPTEQRQGGLFGRVLGGFARGASATTPSATENLQPAFDDFRSGVDTYGEPVILAAYRQQESERVVDDLQGQLEAFEQNNRPENRPNRLTPEDVRMGLDDGQSQQDRFEVRRSALEEELRVARETHEANVAASESAGVSPQARDFTERQYGQIPGFFGFIPGTNQPRAIAAAINPTGEDGTQISRGEEITIRRAAATDAIESGAAAVTVATGPGLLIRAGQGSFRVLSGTAARTSLRGLARETAREGGQEVLEEGFVTGLTSATSGNLPSAGGSASEIIGETLLEVLGGRRGRITVNNSTGAFSVGGQQVQPGQGAYDPSTSQAVFVDGNGNATVIEGVVVEGSVVSVDGVPVNASTGPAPAAGFDPGDSSGQTALAIREPTSATRTFDPEAALATRERVLPAFDPQAALVARERVRTGPQTQPGALGISSDRAIAPAQAAQLSTGIVPAQAGQSSSGIVPMQTGGGIVPAQAETQGTSAGIVPAQAEAQTSGGIVPAQAQAQGQTQQQAQQQAQGRFNLPRIPGVGGLGSPTLRRGGAGGAFAGEVRQRVTADVSTNLRSGQSTSRLVDVGELEVTQRTRLPVEDKLLVGRNNNIRVRAGQPSVRSLGTRRYRKTSTNPDYTPADRIRRNMGGGRRRRGARRRR